MKVKEIPFKSPAVGALMKLQQDGLKGIVDGDKKFFALCRVALFRAPGRVSQSVKPKVRNLSEHSYS